MRTIISAQINLCSTRPSPNRKLLMENLTEGMSTDFTKVYYNSILYSRYYTRMTCSGTLKYNLRF